MCKVVLCEEDAVTLLGVRAAEKGFRQPVFHAVFPSAKLCHGKEFCPGKAEFPGLLHFGKPFKQPKAVLPGGEGQNRVRLFFQQRFYLRRGPVQQFFSV